MIRNWSEKQVATLIGKWYRYKITGFELFLMDATEADNQIGIDYIFEKEGKTESLHIITPKDSTIPSVTRIFPRGGQMEREINEKLPVRFNQIEKEEPLQSGTESSYIEWGPCHPLLSEPIQFKILMCDEVITKASIETGYHFREIERLCIGRKAEDIPDLLERMSSVNGISSCIAFLHAIEEINQIEVPEKARWYRMIFNELSCLHANLHSLNYTARCLGLFSDSARIFKLIELSHEAAQLLCEHPLLFGLIKIGGISRDIPKNTFFSANAVLREMEESLLVIRKNWENTNHLTKRLKTLGKIEYKTAMMMSGRLTRGAGNPEDARKYSALPYDQITYPIPVAEGSDCYARIMLKFDDLFQSLSLIDRGIEQMPEGKARKKVEVNGSGEALVRESGADGEFVIRVGLEEGRITAIRIRNATSINIPFLPECVEKMELTDLPLIVSSFDLDLAGMEK